MTDQEMLPWLFLAVCVAVVLVTGLPMLAVALTNSVSRRVEAADKNGKRVIQTTRWDPETKLFDCATCQRSFRPGTETPCTAQRELRVKNIGGDPDYPCMYRTYP